MMGLLARVAGPRVLSGVLIAAGLAVWYLTAEARDQRERAAKAEQGMRTLAEAASHWARSAENRKAAIDDLQETLRRQAASRAEAEATAAAWERRYNERVRTDDECKTWSTGRLPACVVDGLRALSAKATGTAAGRPGGELPDHSGEHDGGDLPGLPDPGDQ